MIERANERNFYEQKLALVIIDMLAFFLALNGAIFLRYSASLPFTKGGPPPWNEIMLAFPWVVTVWLMVGGMFGAFRIRQGVWEEAGTVVRATVVTFLLVLSASFFYRGFSYSRGMIGFLIPSVVVFALVARGLFRVLRRRALRRFGGRIRIAVAGQTEVGRALIEALVRDRDYYEVVGYLGDTQTALEAGTVPRLGTLSQLDDVCREKTIDSLVLADRNMPDTRVLETIETCLRHQVNWSMVPAVHELLLDRARVELVDGIPLVGMSRSNIVGFNWMLKRGFDMVIASLLLFALAPLMAVVALAIKLTSPGPVFFVQHRVGYRGKTFPFFKFRSMHVGNDDAIHRAYTKRWIEQNQAHSEAGTEAVHKIVDDPRIFAVGRWIRKYSVDELPQLFNVLRGEMSLIGPRPALPYEVDVYREWHRRRFEAPPGITGLWQVSGRNRLSFDEMIKLDIDYLENWSFFLDLKILVRTVRVVLFEHAY